jgi:hypothetical protein
MDSAQLRDRIAHLVKGDYEVLAHSVRCEAEGDETKHEDQGQISCFDDFDYLVDQVDHSNSRDEADGYRGPSKALCCDT